MKKEAKGREPAGRDPLNRQSIMKAAIAIADREGLQALSMRRLGQALRVEAMALYRHFRHKDAIIEAMLDAVHAEIAVPEEEDWKQFMRLRSRSVIEVLSRHPWAASVMESGVAPGPNTMADREGVVRCLRQAGFTIEATVHAITLLDIFVYGAAQQYVRLAFSSAGGAAAVSQGIIETYGGAYPFFSEVLSLHLAAGKYDPLEEFKYGLELILDGISRLLAPEPGSRGAHDIDAEPC